MTDRFHKLLDRAGLPRIRFHDLRHTCISILDFHGVSGTTRARIAGHANVRITENVYTHSNSSAVSQALSLLDSAFDKAS